MVDKCKFLKIEETTNGSSSDPFPREADPSQDYLAAKGIALENLNTHLIDKSGSNIQFTDPTAGARTLNSLRTALTNSFDNSSNGFVSTNVQAAIEEAKTTAEGKARYALSLINNGTLTNGQFIGYNELLPGDQTLIVFPVACAIKEVVFTNSSVNNLGTFTFRKNSTAGASYRTWTINTGATVKQQVLTGINDTFASGDYVTIKWAKTGGSTPSDMALVLYIQNT